MAVLAPAAQWLYGWQKYEERTAAAEQIAGTADAETAAPPEDEFDDDLEDLPENEFELEELEDVMPAEDEEPVTTG